MLHVSTNRVNLNRIKRKYEDTIDRLPAKLGATAVEYVHNNFRAQGFVDKGIRKWKPRKQADRDPRRRAILVKTGHLRRDVRVISTNRSYVAVGTTLPYGRIHNQGGTINHPGGTPFFIKDGRAVWVSRQKGAKLPKTKPHPIRIPQRQFMPTSRQPSQKLNRMLSDVARREINKIR